MKQMDILLAPRKERLVAGQTIPLTLLNGVNAQVETQLQIDTTHETPFGFHNITGTLYFENGKAERVETRIRANRSYRRAGDGVRIYGVVDLISQ